MKQSHNILVVNLLKDPLYDESGVVCYGYDPVGNVIQVNSTCPWLNSQSLTETFTYDASDQLVSAAETQAQSYQLAVTYGNWGKVSGYSLAQTDLQNNTTQSEAQAYTYPATNSIGNSQTLFAPEQRTITDANNNVSIETLTFGINGSLRRREEQSPNSYTEHYLFNSAANLKAYSYDGLDFAYYGYNASNTRTYKLCLSGTIQWQNGQQLQMNLQPHLTQFYPNAYINFNGNGEYTKHYYNGTERIASRLGDGSAHIATTANARLAARIAQAGNRFQSDIQALLSSETQVELPFFQTDDIVPIGATSDIFYYHTNHLGSTAYVTDQNQNVTQGFLYAPFGEITTEYNPAFYSNVLPKYAFNAKELDEETGMYYYEARYYKPPVFTSRDPMFEKYFWMTPYAYCANNPLKYVDPDGRSSYRVDESGNIFLVKRNNKDYDRVYATNSKGKIDKSNYVQIGKEVLNSKTTIKDVKCTYSDGETITTDIDIYTTPNNESATNFFQFVAKNSKVEWSHVHGCENGTKDINYIGTGHMDDGDPSQNYITSKYMGVNVTVERADHSHPNNSSTVSQGDVNVATKIQNRFPNAIFNIYLPKSNRYESYDKNSMPGLLEEVIVKPKN